MRLKPILWSIGTAVVVAGLPVIVAGRPSGSLEERRINKSLPHPLGL
jgi:hypothetical protein